MGDEPGRISDFLKKLNDDPEFRKKWKDAKADERRDMVKHLPQDEQNAMLNRDEEKALKLVKGQVGPEVFVFRFIK
jgi:hypothetical protein